MHLARQQESGLSRQAYCDREGISVSTFSYWKRTQPPMEESSWEPIVVLDDPRMMEIHLSSGVALRIPID